MVPSFLPPTSKVYHGTVRSGQQLYAEKQSLVIFGSVNEGSEIMADGDIFVFGRLCGRVVAGLGSHSLQSSGGSKYPGQENQGIYQIFATSFEPSLVGIGSVFVIPDEYSELKTLRNKAVCATLGVKDTGNHNPSQGSIVSIPCEGENGRIEMIFRTILM